MSSASFQVRGLGMESFLSELKFQGFRVSRFQNQSAYRARPCAAVLETLKSLKL